MALYVAFSGEGGWKVGFWKYSFVKGRSCVTSFEMCLYSHGCGEKSFQLLSSVITYLSYPPPPTQHKVPILGALHGVENSAFPIWLWTTYWSFSWFRMSIKLVKRLGLQIIALDPNPTCLHQSDITFFNYVLKTTLQENMRYVYVYVIPIILFEKSF